MTMHATPDRLAITIFQRHKGLLRASDALRLGIHPRTLYALRDAGTLEQLGRGLYRLADLPPLSNPNLVIVATRYPHAIICLVSALAFHELATQVPHELGHAQQHEQASVLITMRNFLVPAIKFSPQIAYFMIFLGFIFRSSGLIYLGALFYGVMVLFTLITLPVEIDASRRALALLREANLVQVEQDASGARQVLTAAAMTYVAAAVTAILTLLYYLSMANRRR